MSGSYQRQLLKETCKKMSFLYLFIGVFLHWMLLIVSANQINCPLHNVYNEIIENGKKFQISYNGSVSVSYDRDNLAVYKYQASHFVNFLVLDAKITINGTCLKQGKRDYIQSTLDAHIEGLAHHKETKKDTFSLAKCKVDLKKSTIFSKSSPLNVQGKIAEAANTCIQTALCTEFGTIDTDDYIRGKIEPHDFGKNSVMYVSLKEKYPNFELPSNNRNGDEIQGTLNVLADFWLTSLVSRVSGKQLGFVDLPDANEVIPDIPIIGQGRFRSFNGTFSNLRNFRRSQDLRVTNDGLEFAVEGEFELFDAGIHFDKCYIKVGASTSGQIDVTIDRLRFHFKIAMNYNDSPCKTSLVNLKTDIGKISFKLSNGSIFNGLINSIVNKLIHKFTGNIIEFIETKMKEGISAPLKAFNCEQFRP